MNYEYFFVFVFRFFKIEIDISAKEIFVQFQTHLAINPKTLANSTVKCFKFLVKKMRICYSQYRKFFFGTNMLMDSYT